MWADRYLDHLAVERGLSAEHARRVSPRPPPIRRVLREARHPDARGRRRVDGPIVRRLDLRVDVGRGRASVQRALGRARALVRPVVPSVPAAGRGGRSRSRRRPWSNRSCRARCRTRSRSTRSRGCSRPPTSPRPPACGTARSWRCCTGQGCGSRSWSGWTSTTWISTRGSSACWARGARSGRCRSGAFARDAVTAYLTRARPSFASKASRAALFLNQRGGRLTRQSCTRLLAASRGGGRDRAPRHAPHAPPLLRDPPARRRRRRSGGAGAAGARERRHHPDLHAGDEGPPP